MIRLFLILSIIVLIIVDGEIIVSYLKYRKEKFLLQKKHLKDKIVALVSIMSLLSSFLMIGIFSLKMIPISIVYMVLTHLFIILNVLIYYFAKYIDKIVFKNRFNSIKKATTKAGKLKGRDVSVKKRY